MNETTTSQYQKNPDYFSTAEECTQAERQKVSTNPRYKFFKQTHFTAGDIDQFEQYRDATNGRVCIPDVDLNQNRFNNDDLPENINWEKYRDIDAMSVTNTFNYLFNKFKKGIFVKIKEGKMRVFLPFSKKNFTNEWSRRIHVDPKYGDLSGFIRHIQSLEGRQFFPNRINKFIDSWYSNNCLVRYEFPISESDSNNPNMSDMFHTLCRERELPDMEFFVNRRDFPLLKTDGTEPYSHMYDSNSMKLLSHDYPKYCPILSMVSAKNFADLPIPTGDDWARVSRKEDKYFSKTCSRSFEMASVPWEERKPIAVFRGGSTGCGVTIETNPRLKIAYMSSLQPKDDDGQLLLDAGITNWNLRPRKLKGSKYLQTIDIKKLPFSLVDRLTPQEQASYKYIVNIDGHVAAYRLSLELSSGACILMPASKYKLWFSKMLKPLVHFVPVKSDLSDLLEKIKWCKRNDKKCRKIAKNAKKFASMYLTKDGILDYLQRLLFEIKQVNGVYLYNSINILDLQIRNEYDIVMDSKNNFSQEGKKISLIPQQSRSYGLLQGIEWIINECDFTKNSKLKRELFNNGLSVISEYEIGGYSLVQKSTNDKSRTNEVIHEAFVTKMVTNELLKQIPNIVYVFGMYENKDGRHILMEHIQGETLNQYIKSPDFNIQDFCFILLQLSLALHVAQRTCGFVHYDLTPWNIIIQRLPEPVEFDYVIDHETVYSVTTQLVPVIIDMGRTHVIYNNNHHGMINMFKTSTIQDIVTMLATSIYEVTDKNNIPRETVRVLITLANFLSNTGYRNKPFRETGNNGLGDIRFFFRKAKKYTELVSGDKFELENKTPLDFVKYMIKNLKYKFPIKLTNKLRFHMNKGNARQVFDYAFSSTNEERAMSFASVFHRVKHCQLPQPDNLLLVHYTLQSLYDSLSSVYNIMMAFLRTIGMDSSVYEKKYKKTIKYISKKFQHHQQSPIEYNLQRTIPITYNESTFLYPQRIHELIERTQQEDPSDLTGYKEIIEQILLYTGKYELTSDSKQYYINNFKELLATNTVREKDNIANLFSLRNTASMVYSQDLTDITDKISHETGNCGQAKEYQKIYRAILKKL